jgi:secreted trypsin-like serine protease
MVIINHDKKTRFKYQILMIYFFFQGDSGGPLTVGGKLDGIVSWANGCASTYYPAVYTRVKSYLGWIKKYAV